MSCQLSTTDFYDRTGVTPSDISIQSLTAILEDVAEYIKAELDEDFELYTVSEGDAARYYGNNVDVRKIGLWQKSGLTIKLGSLGSSETTTLEEGTDYVLEYYRYSRNPSFSYPVFSVRLFSSVSLLWRYPHGDGLGLPYHPILKDTQYIDVYGVKGMDGMPTELKTLIYNTVAEKVRAINATVNNPSPASFYGEVEKVSDLTSSISYRVDDYLARSRDAFLYDILQHPAISRYITNLKRYTHPIQAKIV